MTETNPEGGKRLNSSASDFFVSLAEIAKQNFDEMFNSFAKVVQNVDDNHAL